MENLNQTNNTKMSQVYCVISVYRKQQAYFREILFKKNRLFQKRKRYPEPWEQITGREFRHEIENAKMLMKDSQPQIGGHGEQ